MYQSELMVGVRVSVRVRVRRMVRVSNRVRVRVRVRTEENCIREATLQLYAARVLL